MVLLRQRRFINFPTRPQFPPPLIRRDIWSKSLPLLRSSVLSIPGICGKHSYRLLKWRISTDPQRIGSATRVGGKLWQTFLTHMRKMIVNRRPFGACAWSLAGWNPFEPRILLCTVSVEDGKLTFNGGGVENNAVTLSTTGGNVALRDANNTGDPGRGSRRRGGGVRFPF